MPHGSSRELEAPKRADARHLPNAELRRSSSIDLGSSVSSVGAAAAEAVLGRGTSRATMTGVALAATVAACCLGPIVAVTAGGASAGLFWPALGLAIGAAALSTGLAALALRRFVSPMVARVAEDGVQSRQRAIARRIQSLLRPRSGRMGATETAAVTLSTAEGAGDYYDVISTPHATWAGVGEVSGRGLQTGLVVLMIQSVVSAVAGDRAAVRPGEVLQILGRVLVENLRRRLRVEGEVAVTLCRVAPDGGVSVAGPHEGVLVYRAARGRAEALPAPASPVATSAAGAAAGSAAAKTGVVESTLVLEPGDFLLLHSDGVTGARNAAGEDFGSERVAAALASAAHEPAASIAHALLDAVERFGPRRTDAATVIVLRYTAEPAADAVPRR